MSLFCRTGGGKSAIHQLREEGCRGLETERRLIIERTRKSGCRLTAVTLMQPYTPGVYKENTTHT